MTNEVANTAPAQVPIGSDFVPVTQNTPIGSDFIPVSQPTAQPQQTGGFWNDLSAMGQRARNNGIGAALLGLTHQGGNVLGDVGTGLVKAGFPNAGSSLQNMGQQAVNVTPQQLGIQNPGMGTNIIAGAAQYSPYILAGSGLGAARPALVGSSEWLSKIPAVGRLLTPGVQQAFQAGALSGATQSAPGTAVSSALHQGLDWAGLVAAPSVIGGGLSKIAGVLTGKPVQDLSDSIYGQLSGQVGKDTLNKQNIGNIINNYNGKVQAIGNGYRSLSEDAASRGYSPVSDLPGQNVPLKSIQLSPSTLSQLNGIANPGLPNSLLSNISPELKASLSQFNESPTYDNAHTLQSMLGNEGASFKSGLANMVDKQTGNKLFGARNSLINDIKSSFTNNGDDDLANQYTNLSNQWANEVMPYKNTPQVWNAINGKKFPNAVNLLSGDDDEGNLQTIREDLSNSPGGSQGVIAQALQAQNAAQRVGGKYVTDPGKILSIYDNLGDNISQFKTPDVDNSIQSLVRTAKNYENLKKWGLIGAAATGVGAISPHIGHALELL